MTKMELKEIKNNTSAIRITYKTRSGSGVLEIDKYYYLKKLKKITHLFKDCTILTFEEIEKVRFA